MEQKDLLLGRMEDLAIKASKAGYAVSRFLTPAEAHSVATNFSRRHDVSLTLDGGYEGSERVRAVFMNPDWGEYERKELFVALKIEASSTETFGHRDVLGSLMGLGIERDTIGDIIESPAVIVCIPELADYLTDTLAKVGRIPVSLATMALQDLPARVENLTIKTNSVASLRLDAVISSAFGLSRGKAQELISIGRVSLNHEPCQQASKELAEGALLSVRGFGRAKLLEVGGTTRKGRILIRIGRTYDEASCLRASH
jgi:RNA-binding protein YlmH